METLLSLDESKQIARKNIPEAQPAKHPGGRSFGAFVMGLILLMAVILFIWIVVSLFRADSGIEVIFPFLDKTETKELIF